MKGIIEITCTVPKVLLLEKLKENRARHATIAAEARVGYVEKAKAALKAKLKQLASGETTQLLFNLQVPLDYTESYDTAIGMLEMSVDPEVTLSAGEYRRLIEDKWEWAGRFLATNAFYSATAAGMVEPSFGGMNGWENGL